MSSNILPAFHLMAKPTGATCNLACEYCFYLDKESLYPGSSFRMSDEVLRAYIKQLLASHVTSEVSVSWQGGEPTLMGLDFFQRSVDFVKKYKRPGQPVTYTLQTNGTHIDEEWCSFFKKHNFLIGLSIDGPAELHNAYRVDKGGQGNFEKAHHAWELLQKHQVDTNILCTVHAANGYHPLEVYRFFRDNLQAQFIQFIPIVEQVTKEQAKRSIEGPDEYPVSSRSVRPEQYGHFLIDVFEEWIHHDVGKVFVQAFDSALASWYGLPAGVCVFQETCGLSLVLEHNGDLYSCDHFVEPAYRLGNIFETPMLKLVSSPRQRQFGLNKRERLPEVCRSCDVLFACHGECPRNRFLKTPDDREGGLNYLCAGYKLFFHHVDKSMHIMANLLRRGRAPAEIMQR
jgi:serine-type anaerobic sulfatase-maturating enzyme